MARNLRLEYFEWLCDHIDPIGSSYRKVFEYLFNREFTWTIPKDENRAIDGVCLRDAFCDAVRIRDHQNELDGPCSVLEMMVALANRYETTIMRDDNYGDRTDRWFWIMMDNLGLGEMCDEIYDEERCDFVITRLLNRRYTKNGSGGLFYVAHPRKDMRRTEIWFQMSWAMSEFINN